jgi:hypothetical protein
MNPGPFAALPYSPRQQFALYFHAAVLRVLELAHDHFGTADAVHERFPFLSGYFEEMVSHGLSGGNITEAQAWWRQATTTWETDAPIRLPLSSLARAAGLTYDDLVLLVQAGLPDEDPRMGSVFEELLGTSGEQRITVAALAAGWHDADLFDARGAIHRLQLLGLLEMPAGVHSILRPCAAIWDAVRGAAVTGAGWVQHRPVSALPPLESLILHSSVAGACKNIPAGLASGAIGAVVIRGPQHNGRATLAGALARDMQKGVIEVTDLSEPADQRWRTAATLAHLVDAVVLTRLELGPSDVVTLPELSGGLVPLFVTLGAAGGLAGTLAHRATTIWCPIPDQDARRQLWASVLGDAGPGLPGLRLTSGNIVRAAQLALASRAGDGGATLATSGLKNAVRSLERPGLEALARRMKPATGWSRLAASHETLTELATLEARCRHRERLAACVGEALDDLSPGVRVLFKGPSGTGKTLAARMLAGALEMDLYRVDLSAVVNKYIGETEKNLERVFARAEELDVILLLDEGDALMTQRTSVQSATDRYANLETNYLLQRLESFDGILIVTTNAADRIDAAFQRRMDVVVEFAPPDATERWAIWQMHLPSAHQVEQDLLYAAAQRCALTGGQIRNAALHASLLAVEAGSLVGSVHLETAIEREYRAAGAISPLRGRAGVR